MYTDHFDLHKAPFENVHDPHFLILSQDQRKALDTMLDAVRQREGWGLLMGLPGEGKTTLIMALIMQLSFDVISAVITNPKLESLDFSNLLSLELGMDGPFDGQDAFLAAFQQYLNDCRKELKSVLIVVDEAQSMSLELLEELKLLGNQDNGPSKVLTILLVAQPEFRSQLKQSKSKGVLQRLRRYHNLKPLSVDESVAYVRHRLSAAGAQREIFEDDAILAAHTASQGNCRLLNTVCDHALQLAYEQKHPTVTAEDVQAAARTMPEASVLNAAAEIPANLPLGTTAKLAQSMPPDANVPGPAPAEEAKVASPREDAAAAQAQKPQPTISASDLGMTPVNGGAKSTAKPAPSEPEVDDFYEEDYDPDLDYGADMADRPAGFMQRAAQAVLRPRNVAIAAAVLLVAGTVFFSLGGLDYAKKIWWRHKQENLIVIPDAPDIGVLPNQRDNAKPKKKGPPDWGPTLYSPSNSARAQGGGHG